ncbi:hypothetical protein BD414DRAFT_581295 [Trametes punicea]|nr:hypothetical protein BD414DRAFT_581295 [Trametes punicea]
MPPDPSRRQTRPGGPRWWWREYFHDHPGTSSRQTDAMLQGTKIKVYCKECMKQNIEKVQADDGIEGSQGVRSSVRSIESISEYLWTLNMQLEKTRGYLNCRSETLLVHLKHCPYQPSMVQTTWLRRAESFASLGLEQELELYELLDFDAPGEADGSNSNPADMDSEHGLALDVELDDIAADIMNM